MSDGKMKDEVKDKTKDEEISEEGTDVFDEDTATQLAISERLLQKEKEEEERRKKYENVTLKDVSEAIDLLTYFIEQSEKATEILNRIKGQQKQLSPQEQMQLALFKQMHLA